MLSKGRKTGVVVEEDLRDSDNEVRGAARLRHC